MIASTAVLRGLVRASWVLLLSRPASALFADISVRRAASATDCPDAAALTERVERIRNATVRAPANEENADGVSVQVDFTRALGGGYAALLSFRGAKRGERELIDGGASCAGLGEAVSLAIALALDRNEEGVAETSAASVQQGERRASPGSSQTVPVQATPPPAERAPRVGLGAMFEGGAGVAFGSPLAGSAAARAQLFYEHVSIELGVRAILPATVDAGAGRVRTSWWFAEAALCRYWGERFAFGPCASFAAGRVRGEGAGYDAVRAAELTSLAAAGGLVLRGPLAGPLEWRLSGALWVPLRKLTFSVENGGVVWESSAISGVFAAGVGVHLR